VLSIRGLSTLYANQQPLIVLDNFPYDGDIANINPADIESVTILKDAAAASIWGVRAGNGVIVLTTKKGAFAQKPEVTFSSSVTLGGKPDLWKTPTMSTSDFIDVEKFLFSKNFYRREENSALKPALSPVVEILIQERNGTLSPSEATARIDALRVKDVRQDLDRYVYQSIVNRQYSVSVRGGGEQLRYSLSSGYDRNQNAAGADYERITVRSGNTVLLTSKLRLDAALFFTQTVSKAGRPLTLTLGNGKRLYPYASFQDENGAPAALNRSYRSTFLQSSQDKGYLDWQYRPLEDFAAINNLTRQTDLLLNTGLHYTVSKTLNAEVLYQLERGNGENRNLQNENSYYTRDLINLYTSVNPDGSLVRNIPVGSILDQSHRDLVSHSLRGQVNFLKAWGLHSVAALGGSEVRSVDTRSQGGRTYGFNEENLTFEPVDFVTTFPQANFPAFRRGIPAPTTFSEGTNRFLSYYANASYSFKGKYVLSASARRDASNLFGVAANKRFVPLWSTGLSWNIGKESFYHFDWLPALKLRATYGVSGNLDPTLSAYTITFYDNGNLNGQPFGVIRNPPNPELRWEQTTLWNVGLDFSSKGNVVNGSVEFYGKKGKDLIGDIAVDQTTGALSPVQTFTYRGNIGSMQGKGVDVSLQTQNIRSAFSWTTDLLFSFNRNKITAYPLKPTYLSTYVNSGYLVNPVVGKPVYSLFSYSWAGLDTLGNPQGVLDGKPTTDYGTLLYSAPAESLVYHGPATAPYFGSFRNTFSWKGFSASANITYRFGYYFLRPSLHYSALFQNREMHGDFSKRWQMPGDESRTTVPSLVYPADSDRDDFYNGSAALVEIGDHIRLQDIGFSYEWKRSNAPSPVKNIRASFYLNNMGLLWKANKAGLDPDYNRYGINETRTYSIGIQATF